MIGLSNSRLRSCVRAFSRLSCVLVPIAVAALGTMFAWVTMQGATDVCALLDLNISAGDLAALLISL